MTTKMLQDYIPWNKDKYHTEASKDNPDHSEDTLGNPFSYSHHRCLS